jgi:hypothetical protein
LNQLQLILLFLSLVLELFLQEVGFYQSLNRNRYLQGLQRLVLLSSQMDCFWEVQLSFILKVFLVVWQVLQYFKLIFYFCPYPKDHSCLPLYQNRPKSSSYSLSISYLKVCQYFYLFLILRHNQQISFFQRNFVFFLPNFITMYLNFYPC